MSMRDISKKLISFLFSCREMGHLFLFVMVGFFCIPSVVNSAEKSFSGIDDTMLMFVGEDLEILTIASRREEKAWDAPAVASVITKKQIRQNGFLTLSDTLSSVPGFYMAQKEYGTKPYLRGISDSVLFLYDTVPFRSDASKILNQVDNELSLASVKRIEIIRGPGSVLWGADAFAGIVNFVPLSGKDIEGIETGVLYSSKVNGRGVFLNTGLDSEFWELFFSISGREGQEDDRNANVVRFWDTESPPATLDERYGSKTPDEARYIEITGDAKLNSAVRVSCRISDTYKPFVYKDTNTNLSWIESSDIYSGHVKLDVHKSIMGSSDIRFSGYISWLKPDYLTVDKVVSQSEKTYFAELIYDRYFFSESGLLTGGVSYREKKVQQAPVWEMYYPDYFDSENDPDNEEKITQLPPIPRADYSTHLWSIFAQYNQKVGEFDIFAGIRNDDQDAFNDHISYSYGLVWKPGIRWMLKTIYGTAYRTPFALHILDRAGFFSGSPTGEDTDHDLEKINNISFQIAFKASSNAKFSLCGFSSHIENHVVANKYAAYSLPNSQDIDGIEFEINYSPFKFLDISSNLTMLRNTGPDEVFKPVKTLILELDDTIGQIFYDDDLNLPYDVGPEIYSNFVVTYRFNDNIHILSRLQYVASNKAIDLVNEISKEVPSFWLFDVNLSFDDFYKGFGVNIGLKNILNRDYELPGTYSNIDGSEFETEILISKKW